MKELTIRQHLLRVLIVVVAGATMASGIAFLPASDYQPTRPIYAAASLLVSLASYFSLRNASPLLGSAALRLTGVFAAVFIATLFM